MRLRRERWPYRLQADILAVCNGWRLCGNLRDLIACESAPKAVKARFVQASDRHEVALLPDCLDDYVCADNPARLTLGSVQNTGHVTNARIRSGPAVNMNGCT